MAIDLIKRNVESIVIDTLADTSVTVIQGKRQAGLVTECRIFYILMQTPAVRL